MKTNELIKTACHNAGLSYIAASRAMGRNDNFIAATVNRNSVPKADTLAAMMDACGYVLAAVPADDVPGTALVIDPSE